MNEGMEEGWGGLKPKKSKHLNIVPNVDYKKIAQDHNKSKKAAKNYIKNSMLIHEGSKDTNTIKEIQRALGIKDDGAFGPKTKVAVMNFQRQNGLKPDGLVGPKTFSLILNISTDIHEIPFIDNDGKLDDRGTYETAEGLIIHKMYLDTDEYVTDKGTTEKHTVYIHHTAGRANPFKTVKGWNDDTRGRIATQFCIGGISIDGNTENDGKVVECFPDAYYAWHLGKVGSYDMHTHSIGIEINNWGYLEKKDGKFYGWPAKKYGYLTKYEIAEDQVVDLGYKFRGHQYYHKYTGAQLSSLKKLLLEIDRRHAKVDLTGGLPQMLKTERPEEAFEFNKDAYNGRVKGILSHVNVRTDKFDCSPQPELIKMILTFS